MHCLLQCLVCCQSIIHWHCDPNSSLLSRIPTTWEDIAGGEKAGWGDLILAWYLTETKNKGKKKCFLLFAFFKWYSWYFTWGAAHEQTDSIQADSDGLLPVSFWWRVLLICYLCWFISLLQVRAAVIKLLRLYRWAGIWFSGFEVKSWDVSLGCSCVHSIAAGTVWPSP